MSKDLKVLTSYLKKVFEEFFIETKFTARMEEDLDEIASGSKNYKEVLDVFWKELQEYLKNNLKKNFF